MSDKRIKIAPLALSAARQFIQFAAGSHAAEAFADDQLEGAVAIHNLLARGRLAYLGDEVGMGKTYVAMGAVALLRHFHPQLRVLYIVPKANLQRKWLKEMRNFASQKWIPTDHRIKTLQGTPAREVVPCENLLEFVHECARDANRDFLLRLSSFSFALGAEVDDWRKKARSLQQSFPGVSKSAIAIDGRSANKEGFKNQFACAVNAVIPHFDLVVIDEGHNLKHGYCDGNASTRNRLLALVLGTKAMQGFPEVCNRVDRALFLSATPVDTDFVDLWNQIDLLDVATGFEELKDRDSDDASRKAVAKQFLVRRLTGIEIAGKQHTKNMYRREWRAGGVGTHDMPLDVPNSTQRLVVALMQKKVSDLLQAQGKERHKKFSRSFQIGMLASFESFERTANRSDEGNFDQSEQTDDSRAREGVDTRTINRLADSFRQTFNGRDLPHPKMDAVIEETWSSMLRGRKSLIFVRRIHSVPEMVEKLTNRYDRWLHERLSKALVGLGDAATSLFERIYSQYAEERKLFYGRKSVRAFVGQAAPEGTEQPQVASKDLDRGSSESFFSWFFRGDGPEGILSGARFAKNRLQSEGSSLSTLFEDNWVAWLLGYPQNVVTELAQLCECERGSLEEWLRCRAATLCSRRNKPPKLQVFRAYQRAALEKLAEQNRNTELKARASEVLRAWNWVAPSGTINTAFPKPERFLNLKTFFTELAGSDTLRAKIWPEAPGGDFLSQFKQREHLRILMSSVIRLGHPLIDLWLLYVLETGSLAAKRRDDNTGEEGGPDDLDLKIASKFVRLLESQMASIATDGESFNCYCELWKLGQQFKLLQDVNFPEVAEYPMAELQRYFADHLGNQQPIAGMYGGVVRRAVTQFRMPGYPYALIATDVLQEGEDLHTFCDRIMHYGLSWTPSSTEQRTGRVDRIGSLVHRRLQGAFAASTHEYLQVYFPYLADTYEFVQVQVVLSRLNRFLEMLHDLRHEKVTSPSEIDVSREIHRLRSDALKPYDKPLKSDFEISEELLRGDAFEPITSGNNQFASHLEALAHSLSQRLAIEWQSDGRSLSKMGTAFVDANNLVTAEADRSHARVQPFVLVVKNSHSGVVLLRCVSPVGCFDRNRHAKMIFQLQRRYPSAKLCAILDDSDRTYNLSIEADLPFSVEMTQPREVIEMVGAVLKMADTFERELLKTDERIDTFKVDLQKEPNSGANRGDDKGNRSSSGNEDSP